VRKEKRSLFERRERSLFEKSSAKTSFTPIPKGIGAKELLSVSFGKSPRSPFQQERTSSHPQTKISTPTYPAHPENAKRGRAFL